MNTHAHPTWGLVGKQTFESGVLHLVLEHNVSFYVSMRMWLVPWHGCTSRQDSGYTFAIYIYVMLLRAPALGVGGG
jgi:hypothetical protein